MATVHPTQKPVSPAHAEPTPADTTVTAPAGRDPRLPSASCLSPLRVASFNDGHTRTDACRIWTEPEPTSPAPVEPTPADTLRQAALYLQRHGWTQFSFYIADNVPFPAACAAGAIGAAVCGRPVDVPDSTTPDENTEITRAERVQIHRTLAALAGHLPDFHSIPWAAELVPLTLVSQWNDYPDQSAEQVVTALNAAADDYDRVHGGDR